MREIVTKVETAMIKKPFMKIFSQKASDDTLKVIPVNYQQLHFI